MTDFNIAIGKFIVRQKCVKLTKAGRQESIMHFVIYLGMDSLASVPLGGV